VKILVIRFSSIGDIVLTSPVLRCLKNQLDAELHYVTKSTYKCLLEHNPCIDKIHLLEKDLNELIDRLKGEKYDLVIDLHHNLRSNLIRKKLAVRSIGFNKINLEKALMVHLKWNRLPDKHLVDRYFEALKEIGLENDGKGLEFHLDKKIPEIWSGIKKDLDTDKKILALVLGGTYFTKRLPKEKWLELIEQLNENIVLIGGKEDLEIANWLKEHTSKKLLCSAGITDIQGSAFILSKSDAVISGDTGMMHIAAAFRKPVISIWGNTIPAFGMFPYYGEDQVGHFIMEVSDLACRPCSKLGKATCPRKHFKCMVDQDIEMIVKNMELVLMA
jgi:ADP-heptose:LPS heptosyltransferase